MHGEEFILCAAIWVNDGKIHKEQPINIKTGFVVCGRRHNNCYRTIKAIVGDNSLPNEIRDLINSMSIEEARRHQGFITSNDRYVNRKEGWKIAKSMGQIQFGPILDNEAAELISENLY